MSDQPTLVQVLATLENIAGGMTAMRADVGKLRDDTTVMRGEFGTMGGDISALHSEFGKVRSGFDKLRGDFFDELGKTRMVLLEKMQGVRDDVTVNLAAAQLAEQAARGAVDQGRALTDLLAALTRQVRHLQDTVDAMRNGGGTR